MLVIVATCCGCGRLGFTAPPDGAGVDASTAIEFLDFASCSSAELQLNASARCTDGVLRLSDQTLRSAGSAFLPTPFMFGPASRLTIRMTARISPVPTASGIADGIALVTHASAQGASALSSGGDFGYAGLVPSAAIELDTYRDPSETTDNHVGLDINGSTASVVSVDPGFRLANGIPFTLRLDYDGEARRLEVAIDPGMTATTQVFATNTDLALGAPQWIGITGSSGAGPVEINDVLAWSVDFTP